MIKELIRDIFSVIEGYSKTFEMYTKLLLHRIFILEAADE
jgi:hypothetical protein